MQVAVGDWANTQGSALSAHRPDTARASPHEYSSEGSCCSLANSSHLGREVRPALHRRPIEKASGQTWPITAPPLANVTLLLPRSGKQEVAKVLLLDESTSSHLTGGELFAVWWFCSCLAWKLHQNHKQSPLNHLKGLQNPPSTTSEHTETSYNYHIPTSNHPTVS